MPTITANVTPAQGQTDIDVLALVIKTQDPRALIADFDCHQDRATGIVHVTINYDTGAGEAEYADCADRITNMTGVGGVDGVRLR